MKFIPAEMLPYRSAYQREREGDDPAPKQVLLRPVAIVWVAVEMFTAADTEWVRVQPISGERMRCRAGVLRKAFGVKREQLEQAA